MNQTSIERDQTTNRELPILFGKGFGMGLADVIPGVSGGTIALIAGIYERYLEAIKSINAEAVQNALKFRIKTVFEIVHWKFLITLLLGIQMAIYFSSRVLGLPNLIHTHPEPVYGLFFGLIIGSIIILLRRSETYDWKLWSGLIVGALTGLFVVTLVPVDTPEALPFVFLYGLISIIAMILPGISGSFILLILRKYDYIFGTIAKLGTDQTLDALVIIGVFALGSAVGLMSFSRILSWLLKRYHHVTMAILIGFLIGSLYVIWPYQHREYQEIVRKEVVSANNPEWQRLLKQPENPNLPEFERAVRSEEGTQQFIEHVKRKLVISRPVRPRLGGSFYDGFLPWIMVVTGIVLIFILEGSAKSIGRRGSL